MYKLIHNRVVELDLYLLLEEIPSSTIIVQLLLAHIFKS